MRPERKPSRKNSTEWCRPFHRGDRLHLRSGDVWVTQHGDSKGYVLRAGDSMTLSGDGTTLAMAYKPSLLGWHRAEPRAAREPAARVVLALLREVFA